MSKVIQVLETMANNATVVNKESITALLANTDLNDAQQQAITNSDVEALFHSTDEISKIQLITPLSPAEDDEPDEHEHEHEQEESDTETNSLIASAR